MFGSDPRKLEKIMKKLNMNVREIAATEVVIKSEDKEIIIKNPQVMIADMMGKEVYQITGDVYEGTALREEDIHLVMAQTGKDKQTVVETLKRLNNDLAKAIMELKEE